MRVVPHKYRPVVMAIEETVNLRGLMIKDLCASLLIAKEGYDVADATDGVKKILLTEEWRLPRHGQEMVAQAKTAGRLQVRWQRWLKWLRREPQG